MSFVVNVSYDEAEHIYYVISSNIPGLHIEASTFEEFVDCAKDFAPDLLGDNAAGAKIMFEREVVLLRRRPKTIAPCLRSSARCGNSILDETCCGLC